MVITPGQDGRRGDLPLAAACGMFVLVGDCCRNLPVSRVKNLYLLRHAKSSWAEPALADHDRPLNRRGTRDAPRMGAALRELMPPLPATVSTALRARLTLAGLCEGWPELAPLAHREDAELYTFSEDELWDWLRGQDDAVSQLFLIGHNPALTGLLARLAPDRAPDNLPTAGYAALALDLAHWRHLAPGCGRVERLLFPRQL